MSIDLEGRYSRQELLRRLGVDGQARICGSRVAVLGCGGLGAEVASLLVRGGVGLVRIVDRDIVDLTNLQRQALFDERDVQEAMPKAAAAARRLAQVNSEVHVEAVVADIHSSNIESLIAGVDLVVDGFDNFEGRFLLNDACVKSGLPWIYAGCVESNGVLALIVPGKTPCLRCVFPEPPDPGVSPTCDTVGILGPVAHTTASLEAAQALRWLATRKAPAQATLIAFDVWDLSFERIEITLERDNRCPCCSERRFEFLDQAPAPVQVNGPRRIVWFRSGADRRPDLGTVADRFRPRGQVTVNPHLVRLHTETVEVTLFADGRAVVKGTDDPGEARRIVADCLNLA